MRLSRRKESSIIWPGFVDAVTTLLMVLMFVLTIFTVMQSVLQETIDTQDGELDSLTSQISQLSDALGLERSRAQDLEDERVQQAAQLSSLTIQLREREADLSDALGQISALNTQVSGFEAQVAALLSQNAEAEAQNVSLESALAAARDEVDASAEAARLAAARREALQALLAQMRNEATQNAQSLETAQAQITQAEQAALADAAALEALRARLASADDERLALTLALEEQRKRAEETLTLLAANDDAAAKRLSERDTALAVAQQILSEEQEKSLAAARKVALLNAQIEALRLQLGGLESVLNEARTKDEAAQVQLDTLGNRLNTALSQVAAEQKRRADLEAKERARLERENRDLSKFTSTFFSELSLLLEGKEGVKVVGDRFVFSSEVLFAPGSAELLPEGRAQIARVAQILSDVRDKIPADIDWIVRVDGHTDATPVLPNPVYKDNWELSQIRALSVVRFMQDQLGFPPERLAATGFGEYRPVAQGNNEAAYAQNRRIELKLTER